MKMGKIEENVYEEIEKENNRKKITENLHAHRLIQ